MTGDLRRIAPIDLPRLAPTLKHYLRSPLPAWPDIAGELSLERTVWRLLQAIDQERYGANGSPLTAEGSIP
jgi:hypothetical protein